MSVGLYPRGLDYHDLACNINFTRSRIRSSASNDGGLYTLTSSDTPLGVDETIKVK